MAYPTSTHWNTTCPWTGFYPTIWVPVPDIDLDFPRNIREELIVRVHRKWGWDRAALTGMISTYQMKGAIRDLGKALGLPAQGMDKLAKRVDSHGRQGIGTGDAATARVPGQGGRTGLA